jgi:hemerythrin superfamily protein
VIAGERLSSLGGMLAGDHDRLDRSFQAILTRANGGDWQQLETEWIAFQRELLGHLEAEEKHVIPALARDRPVAAETLLSDHAGIRASLIELGIDLDLHCLRAERVAMFVEALRGHAKREEGMFYPWADGHLPVEAATDVRERIGKSRHR